MFIVDKYIKQEEMKEGGEPVASPKPAEPTTPAPATKVPEAQEPAPAKVAPSLNYKDSATKQIGTMLSDAGIDPVQARDAISANAGSCTPEIYAALSAKHGEGMASLLAGQMTSLHNAGVEQGNTQDKAIYSQVQDAFKGITEQSGEQTWKELSGWAKENVSTEERTELNAAIKQGGLVAKLAVQEIVNAFQQSGEYSQDMVGVEGDNVPSAPSGGDLTRQEYTEQLDALLAKGHVYGRSKEIKTLDVRRTRSASRGI